ncbi:MAG: glycerol-3-phosphate acyltransferase [Lachnospiraceae bacterium]
MRKTITYILLGYLSGSVLYAVIFTRLFKKEDAISKSKDQNPGTANAFMYGGFGCGMLTLICELLKGFIPVYFYMNYVFMHYNPVQAPSAFTNALVIAAPVIGHAFPVFHKFHGGKAVAVTFGCLLGLFPIWYPAVFLAFFFILFSLVLRVSPHFYRTIAAYVCTLVSLALIWDNIGIWIGFLFITVVVCIRFHLSSEAREGVKVRLLWMR